MQKLREVGLIYSWSATPLSTLLWKGFQQRDNTVGIRLIESRLSSGGASLALPRQSQPFSKTQTKTNATLPEWWKLLYTVADSIYEFDLSLGWMGLRRRLIITRAVVTRVDLSITAIARFYVCLFLPPPLPPPLYVPSTKRIKNYCNIHVTVSPKKHETGKRNAKRVRLKLQEKKGVPSLRRHYLYRITQRWVMGKYTQQCHSDIHRVHFYRSNEIV